VLGEALCRFKNGGVLDGGGDAVVAGMEQAEEGSIIAFGAAGVEYHFRIMAVEKLGQGFTCAVDGSAGALAVHVDGGGVAEVLHPVRAHGLEHLRQQGCCGIGVHVDTRGWEVGRHQKSPIFKATTGKTFRSGGEEWQFGGGLVGVSRVPLRKIGEREEFP
jgi:hypothetical protein